VPAETRRINFREDVYLEVDVSANEDVTALRAFNETDKDARCRLTVTSGPSVGRTTGYHVIPFNQGAPGTAVLNVAVPTAVNNRLRLEWDATRERYTNLDKDVQWPWFG
jgi:hypothetical protein